MSYSLAAPLQVAFIGGVSGLWRIDRIDGVHGETLDMAERLDMREGPTAWELAPDCAWTLRGITSNARYTTRAELDALGARQEGLARPQATRAALIPIRKSPAWWAMGQDERRLIFEEQSRHIAIGLRSLPAVARRLHHGRDLGEPFDFLTWFEYAPDDAQAFEGLVNELRRTPEWAFVDREVDIRLSRE